MKTIGKIIFFSLLLVGLLQNTFAAQCEAYDVNSLKSCVNQISSHSGITLTANITCSSNCCGETNGEPLINLASTSNKTIKGNIPGSKARFIKRTADQKVCPLISAGNSTTIKDLTIDENNDRNPCDYGDNCPSTIMVHRKDNVTMDNVHVFNGKAYVVYVWGADYFTFKNGQITTAGIIGLYVGHNQYYPSNHLRVTNSLFRWARTNAIAIEGVKDVNWNDSWINNNEIYGNHYHGLWHCDSSGTCSNGGQVYIAQAEGLVLYNNIIRDGSCNNCNAGVTGLELGYPNGGTSVDNVTISANQIYGNTGYGMWQNIGSTMPHVGFNNNNIYNNLGCSGPTFNLHPPCQ